MKLDGSSTTSGIGSTDDIARPSPTPYAVDPDLRMLSTRAAGLRALATSRARHRFLSTSCPRCAAANASAYVALLTKTPLAKKLAETGVWKQSARAKRADAGMTTKLKTEGEEPKPKKARRKAGGGVAAPEEAPVVIPSRPPIKGDKTRVNIVSEPLCDDILSYIGKSLERHRGCDILDISPGAGLWSRKLNDLLQPRTHILMEPEAKLYEPFLQELLDRPGTRLVPESGIIWSSLASVLTPEYLPHQKPADQTYQNDTLLVTANLAFHPRKRYLGFDSVAQLVLHQFIEAIRTGKFFQQYGQVRMLIWCRRDDKSGLLPRIMARRRRTAIDAEINCRQVNEVVGSMQSESPWYTRDLNLDSASACGTAKRMQAAGLKMPEGRAPLEHKEALDRIANGTEIPVASIPPTFERVYHKGLEGLRKSEEEQEAESEGDDEGDRAVKIKKLEWRLKADGRKHREQWELELELQNINQLHLEGKASEEEIRAREEAWETRLLKLSAMSYNEFLAYRDNMHYFRQDPPIMMWDRREYEPLTYEQTEFFPNTECALLDIQPGMMHPLVREFGPRTERAGETFEVLVKTLISTPARPLDRQLDAIWPGAADWVRPRWTSLYDMAQGGVPSRSRSARPVARSLNRRQWEELLEVWMAWPLRPSFGELLTRASDDSASEFQADSPSNDDT